MTTDGGWPKHGPIKELEPAEPTQSTYLKCNRPPCTTEDSPHSWAYKECTKAYGKEICQLLPVHGSKVERINDSYQSSYIFNPRATAIPHTTHSLHHDPVETPTPISFPSPTAYSPLEFFSNKNTTWHHDTLTGCLCSYTDAGKVLGPLYHDKSIGRCMKYIPGTGWVGCAAPSRVPSRVPSTLSSMTSSTPVAASGAPSFTVINGSPVITTPFITVTSRTVQA